MPKERGSQKPIESPFAGGLKMPPQNIEAEISTLGALMLDSNAVIRVTDILKPEDFYRPQHQNIYAIVLDLFERHQPIDVLSVSSRLREKGFLDEIGGTSYLTDLVNAVPSASNVAHYAEIVRKKKILRELIGASAEIAELGYNEGEEIDELLDRVERKVFAISQGSLKQKFAHLKGALEEAWERIDNLHKNKDQLRGIPTGFKDLDNLLAGFQRSDLIIIAGRPSFGKTALALDIARHAAVDHKIPTGIFSLEMSTQQLVDRFIAAEARVDLWKLRTGNLTENSGDFLKIQEAMGKLSEAPLFIDDEVSSNVLQMRAMARRLKAEHGQLGLIVIDYLQLMQPKTSSDNMVQQITEISRSLKGLARELNVPVVAISQLSRAVEQRHPPIPRLSDLRESGCLTGDTLITRADTGERIPIRDLVGLSSIPVFSMTNSGKIETREISKVFSSGVKETFELRTRSGRSIKASGNHPFFTIGGWKQLEKLGVRDFVAVPRAMHATNPNALWKFVGSYGSRGGVIPELIESLSAISANTNTDIIPKEAWHVWIAPQKAALGLSWRDLSEKIDTAYCGNTLFKSGLSRKRMARVAESLESSSLLALAKSGIYWDEIVSITQLGKEEVYDATVPGTHNFVANDFVVHNSIEQDADVVIFLYREDRYKENSSKRDQADIIVAKHRNGPTGKILLFFDQQKVSFSSLEENKGFESFEV